MVRSEAAFPTKEGKERSRFPDKRGEGAKPLSRQKRGRSEAAFPTKEGKERSRLSLLSEEQATTFLPQARSIQSFDNAAIIYVITL